VIIILETKINAIHIQPQFKSRIIVGQEVLGCCVDIVLMIGFDVGGLN